MRFFGKIMWDLNRFIFHSRESSVDSLFYIWVCSENVNFKNKMWYTTVILIVVHTKNMQGLADFSDTGS